MNRQDVVFKRLLEGDASVDQLATAVWGQDYNWPLTYRNDIRNLVCLLRKRGHIIGVTNIYSLGYEAHGERMKRLMEITT